MYQALTSKINEIDMLSKMCRFRKYLLSNYNAMNEEIEKQITGLKYG